MIDQTHNHPELGRLTRQEIEGQISDGYGPLGATSLVFTDAEKTTINRLRAERGLKPKFGASEGRTKPAVSVPRSNTAKPTSRASQPAAPSIDVKAIKAAAFAEGFRAASNRMKAVMALPIAKANPDIAIQVLADPRFATWSSSHFAGSLQAALQANQTSIKQSWDHVHNEVEEQRNPK